MESFTLKIPGEDDVVITITDVDRNKVRVAINAPKHILVFRNELLLDRETE